MVSGGHSEVAASGLRPKDNRESMMRSWETSALGRVITGAKALGWARGRPACEEWSRWGLVSQSLNFIGNYWQILNKWCAAANSSQLLRTTCYILRVLQQDVNY